MGRDRMQLFDNNDDSSSDDLSKIEIDHEFAKRLEHNKKREDLQRYEELKKQGKISDSDDSSSSEDEDDTLEKADTKFLDALIKIKNKDPILFDKNAKLFDSDSEESTDGESDEKVVKEKKQKPLYLKDVVSKQVIENGADFDDEEMDDDDDDIVRKVKTYSEEQEEIRSKLIKDLEEAENGNDVDGDLFKVKDNGVEEDEDDVKEIKEKCDVYFGEDEKLDEESKFLKKFFEKQMWRDEDKGKEIVDDDGIELSEDEEEVERQEDYEREFNFRFEENAGDRVMGHSRKVEGSVRKVESARKLQRERKKERMKQAEEERKEELKRLKNLKKKEINEKLEKIRKVAGIDNDDDIALDEDDLNKEFDPEEYDRKMMAAFGDKYYNAVDANPEFGSDEDDDGLVKPDFEGEDELLGLPKDWDMVENYSEDGDGGRKESKRKRKRKPSDVEKAVREELMEEYYKLDYEGTVGDLKTRFKYKPVKAKRFGLNPAELLLIDDKELNQYVPLKKLATYQEKGFKVDRMKTLQMKEKVMEIYNKQKKKTKNSGVVAPEAVEAVEEDTSMVKEPSGETSTPSRKSKRRQRQRESKLAPGRLVAYGKQESKSKSKAQ